MEDASSTLSVDDLSFLVGLCVDAIALADVVQHARDADDETAAAVWSHVLRLDPDHPRGFWQPLRDKLNRVGDISNIPPNVLTELFQIEEICHEAAAGHPTFAMVVRFVARSDLRKLQIVAGPPLVVPIRGSRNAQPGR